MSELQTTGRRREVGATLKRIRQERGWPAYLLAERLDWTPSHISRSEAGKRRVTDVDAGYYLGITSDREMPDMAQRSWRKSSYSGASGNNSCVEVAFVVRAVGVRDSKNTGGPTLAFSPIAWRRFVRR